MNMVVFHCAILSVTMLVATKASWLCVSADQAHVLLLCITIVWNAHFAILQFKAVYTYTLLAKFVAGFAAFTVLVCEQNSMCQLHHIQNLIVVQLLEA